MICFVTFTFSVVSKASVPFTFSECSLFSELIEFSVFSTFSECSICFKVFCAF